MFTTKTNKVHNPFVIVAIEELSPNKFFRPNSLDMLLCLFILFDDW
jgi:hypothetical protein